MSAATAYVLADVQEMLEVEGWLLEVPPTPTRLWMTDGPGDVEADFQVDDGWLRASVTASLAQAELRLPLALHDAAEPMVQLVLAVVRVARESEV